MQDSGGVDIVLVGLEQFGEVVVGVGIITLELDGSLELASGTIVEGGLLLRLFGGLSELIEETTKLDAKDGIGWVKFHGLGIGVNRKLIGAFGDVDEVAVEIGEILPDIGVTGSETASELGFVDGLRDELGDIFALSIRE